MLNLPEVEVHFNKTNHIFILHGWLEVLAASLQQQHLFSISILSPLAPIHIPVSTFLRLLRLCNVPASGSQVAECPFLFTQMFFHFTAFLPCRGKHPLSTFLYFLPAETPEGHAWSQMNFMTLGSQKTLVFLPVFNIKVWVIYSPFSETAGCVAERPVPWWKVTSVQTVRKCLRWTVTCGCNVVDSVWDEATKVTISQHSISNSAKTCHTEPSRVI